MSADQQYMDIILKRIRVCKTYRPKFGQGGSGVSLNEFRTLYGTDIFYSWFGLDNPMMYAAHRAAGGITSIYRQIGLGCEELYRQILMDKFGLSANQAVWSYSVTRQDGSKRRLSLDGRVDLNDISLDHKREQLRGWIQNTAGEIGIAEEIGNVLKGIVFEVRQGYKSKDAKRQNADVANAATAYSQGYLPIVLVLSTQIDGDIVDRYKAANWLLLLGYANGSTSQSTYQFTKNIVGYDLKSFFERNATVLKQEIEDVLETLLNTNE